LEKLIIFSEAEIRALPLPSREQHQAFVEHLRDVHSWYKHLPLLTGGKFVVFLAPDAGEGYPSQHPHLCYGNTIEGYRRAFGYLDYIWSVQDCPFDRVHTVPMPRKKRRSCPTPFARCYRCLMTLETATFYQ
jgi:hypothetical protein